MIKSPSILKMTTHTDKAYLTEVDAEAVCLVLPRDVDLGVRAAAFPLNFCASRQRERRLLCDQLQQFMVSFVFHPQS